MAWLRQFGFYPETMLVIAQ